MGQLDNNLNFVQEANKVLPGKSYLSGWCIAASKDIWNKLEIRRDPLALYDRTPYPQIFSEEFGIAILRTRIYHFEPNNSEYQCK